MEQPFVHSLFETHCLRPQSDRPRPIEKVMKYLFVSITQPVYWRLLPAAGKLVWRWSFPIRIGQDTGQWPLATTGHKESVCNLWAVAGVCLKSLWLQKCMQGCNTSIFPIALVIFAWTAPSCAQTLTNCLLIGSETAKSAKWKRRPFVTCFVWTTFTFKTNGLRFQLVLHFFQLNSKYLQTSWCPLCQLQVSKAVTKRFLVQHLLCKWVHHATFSNRSSTCRGIHSFPSD